MIGFLVRGTIAHRMNISSTHMDFWLRQPRQNNTLVMSFCIQLVNVGGCGLLQGASQCERMYPGTKRVVELEKRGILENFGKFKFLKFPSTLTFCKKSTCIILHT